MRTTPWDIENRDGEFCVIRRADKFNQGCHDSREKAEKQMAALYAKEKTMTAAAAPLKPPRAWFDMPEADGPTPVTITADGQVYGHLALWDSCHTGFLSAALEECIRPEPSPSGNQWFNTGALETDDGSLVNVGALTYGGPHAPLSMGLSAAASHYDTTSKVGAFVTARDGRHGIWLTGALRSDLPPEGKRDILANPPSGDWRPWKGARELVAALSVPVQGFPVPRAQIAVTASGIGAMILPGLTTEDIAEVRSKEFLRRRESLAAAVRA